MRLIVQIACAEVTPTPASVLAAQGVPAAAGSERLSALLERAFELHHQLARPRAVVEDVDAAEFTAICAGEGRNEARTPVEDVSARALRCALFVITLGEDISSEIRRLFAAGDFALGAMLDAMASRAAELGAGVLAGRVADAIAAEGAPPARLEALEYSPGYCGWSISGQKKLFERLRPEEIGVSLNESFLMRPLKSVSGVILVGPPGVHDHDESYPCCLACPTRECRERRAVIRRVSFPRGA